MAQRRSGKGGMRRPARRGTGRRLSWRGKLALAGVSIALAFVAWAEVARQMAPVSNTSLTHFDAIIVLGTPADEDGNPTPAEMARVNEAVREYERGVAPRIIMSGGAAANRYVEAEVMEKAAHAQGIPEEALLVEGRSKNTIQNACFCWRIMKQHGWHSAEVVSTKDHLRRAALIFGKLPLEWRMDPAAPVGTEPGIDQASDRALETLKTVRYLTWAQYFDRCGF